MSMPKVTAASTYQDYLNVKASYDRAVATIQEQSEQIKQLTAERDNARGQVEALTFERDQVRAAWHKALDQVAREQDVTRQAMKRALELNRTAQQYNAVVRSAFTPEQWMAAAAVAQERYPNVFDKEPHP
jgi:chromosome segregation ATPase